MNDSLMLDDLFADTGQDVTIRLGRADDAAGLERLATLDERDPGAGPHLVAEDEGEIVAALSLTDGTAIGDPFRLTLPTIGLLRARATELGKRRRRRGRRLVATATLAALALVGILGTSAAATAAPKPGFVPDTWVGTGTISGTTTDGPFTTHFTGGVSFTIRVDAGRRVAGNGTWRLSMLGSEDAVSGDAVDSSMQGTAAVRFAGNGTKVTFSGTQQVTGEIRGYGTIRPISFSRPLTGTLTITRAGKCRVVGATRLPDGVRLDWSAVLKGSGTCRA